jgi:hypothetical protein
MSRYSFSFVYSYRFVRASCHCANPPFQAFVVLLFLFPSETDSTKLAGCLAVAAGDALVVPYLSDIHLAGPQAGVAVHTLVFVHLDGKQRDPVKQTVECP